jgi:hypothetical protein
LVAGVHVFMQVNSGCEDRASRGTVATLITNDCLLTPGRGCRQQICRRILSSGAAYVFSGRRKAMVKNEREFTSHAIDAVTKHYQDADIVKCPRVSDDFALHHGRVFRVEFTDTSGELLYNYVYYDGRGYRVFPRSRDLVQFIARAPEPIVSRVLQIVGISGLIAVLITITICWLILRQQQVPEILSHALTTVLGFYFAASVYESSKKPNA